MDERTSSRRSGRCGSLRSEAGRESLHDCGRAGGAAAYGRARGRAVWRRALWSTIRARRQTHPTYGQRRRAVHLFDDRLCYDRSTDLFSMAFGLSHTFSSHPCLGLPLAVAKGCCSEVVHSHPSQEVHAAVIHAGQWRSVKTSRAVARAILPVKRALLTGRIARATFRVGTLCLMPR